MLEVMRLAIGMAKLQERYALTDEEVVAAFAYLLQTKGLAVVKTA